MLNLNWCGSFSFDPWIILELGWFQDCSWGFLSSFCFESGTV